MFPGCPEGCICQHQGQDQQKRSEAKAEELPHQQDAGHGKDGPGEGQRVEGESERPEVDVVMSEAKTSKRDWRRARLVASGWKPRQEDGVAVRSKV